MSAQQTVAHNGPNLSAFVGHTLLVRSSTQYPPAVDMLGADQNTGQVHLRLPQASGTNRAGTELIVSAKEVSKMICGVQQQLVLGDLPIDCTAARPSKLDDHQPEAVRPQEQLFLELSTRWSPKAVPV